MAGGVGARRKRTNLLAASTMAAVLGVASWTLVAACSSSNNISSPNAGTSADAQQPPEPDDAGAPDVLGDTLDQPCDPVKQDCADPALRCQLIFLDGDWVTGCEAAEGSALVNEGQACTRTNAGHDNCVNGSTCLPDGVTERSCHKICAKDSDCSSGSKCSAVTTIAPYFGACVKSCAPFSTECSGATCSDEQLDNTQLNVFEACRPIGTGAVGSPCKSAYDCGPNMNCQGSGNFTCKAMCDDAHPCVTGTCKKSSPGALPNNGGLCR